MLRYDGGNKINMTNALRAALCAKKKRATASEAIVRE